MPVLGTQSLQKQGFAGELGEVGQALGGPRHSLLMGAAGNHLLGLQEEPWMAAMLICSCFLAWEKVACQEAAGAKARLVPEYAQVLGVSSRLKAAEFLPGKKIEYQNFRKV